MTFEGCLDGLDDFSEPQTVICTKPTCGKSIHYGDSGNCTYNLVDEYLFISLTVENIDIFYSNDLIFLSGGPLIRKSDGSLIGITSAFKFNSSETVLNVFTKIQSFNDWISETTGLDLPHCPY